MSLRGGNYNQSAKALPTPIAFSRHAGEGTARDPAREILALSKLDWNNEALYGLTPSRSLQTTARLDDRTRAVAA